MRKLYVGIDLGCKTCAGADMCGFSQKTGAGNRGSTTYQLSPDNTTWYYHNGSSWVTTGNDHSKSNSATDIDSHIADFNRKATSRLYVRSFPNSNGMQYASLDSITLGLESTLHTWYLAEGTTAWGFSTYITIQNPNGSPVGVTLTYMPKGAGNVTEKLNLPANSQTTLTNDHLVQKMGNVCDFSTRVEATDKTKAIAVDRTMEWTGGEREHQARAPPPRGTPL